MQKFVLSSALTLILGFVSCQQSANQPVNDAAVDSTTLTVDSTTMAQDTAVTSVTVDEFEKAIAAEGVQLIDVRSAEEYAEGHIKGSVNLDLKAEDFVAKANETLNKEQSVAVYCRSGRRSKEAAKILAKEGFKIVELDCGFNGWKEAQREIEK